MEGKVAHEEECKREEGESKRSSGPGDVKRLNSMLGKREGGSVVHNLFPFYQSKIAHGLEEFYDEHLDEFDDEDEHRLVYTDIFRKFEELFEGFLEEFVEEQGLDKAAFYEELSAVSDKHVTGRSAVLVKLVAAQTDYDFFVQLMRDKARERRARDEVGGGGGGGGGGSRGGRASKK